MKSIIAGVVIVATVILAHKIVAEEAPSVSISGDRIVVSVPTNSYGEASKLHLVWDVIDHGENISAWPIANRATYSGTIAATATTYSFSKSGIPVGSVVRAIVTSDVRLIDSWIALGNGQYINTGKKPNETYGVEIKFRRTGASGNWGSVIGGKLDNFTLGQCYNSDKEFYLRYSEVEAGKPMFTISDTSVPHTFKILNRKAWLDGEEVALKNNPDDDTLGTDSYDIYVGSSVNANGNGTSGRFCYGEWHYVKLYNHSGEETMWLVPALRSNDSSSEILFYDKISGKCFGNAGAGTLIYDTSASVTGTISSTTACSPVFVTAKTAYWIGRGDLTNVNDPANWACTNNVGVEVSDAPDVNTFVYVRGASNFNVPAGQRLACNKLVFENVTLAADCDWRGLAEVNTVTDDSALEDNIVIRPAEIIANINLSGHTLTLAHINGAGEITDTVGGGELHIDVPNGETVENSTFAFTGALKLVKDGAGTFVSARSQTYTGGTVANAGWLKQGTYSGAWGSNKSLITIRDGAGFDWNGMVNNASSTAYNFKITGTGPDGDAAMKTSRSFADNYWNANFIADMELDGDATVMACRGLRRVYGFEYVNAGGHNLVMNGHTLTVVAADSFAFRGVTVTGGGTIVSIPDTVDGVHRLSFYDWDSDLSTTILDVYDFCGLNLEKSVTVKDFIDRRTIDWNDGTKDNNKVTVDRDSNAGTVIVLEKYHPHGNNLISNVKLGDATHLSPILDLSSIKGTYTIPVNRGVSLSVAEGATVSVNLVGRTDLDDIASRNSNQYLIEWNTQPKNITFLPDAVTAERFNLEADSSGLRLVFKPGFVLLIR